MRSKENAHDYRYFPDPDLPPLMIDEDWIARVKSEMPELPAAMATRFISAYALPMYDADQLTYSLAFARYFETATDIAGKENAKPIANWMLGELSAALNRYEIEIEDAPVSPEQLAALVMRVQDGTLSNKGGKEVFDALWQNGNRSAEAVDRLIAERGLQQISDTGALEKIVDDVLAQHPAVVAEFRAGKEKAFNSLVGQIMKASRGKANPVQVNALLKKKL
jgi:aspartyl-tRNA(Asn)/glutamyl-tRNA(Gln) amidotransferase subunit B